MGDSQILINFKDSNAKAEFLKNTKNDDMEVVNIEDIADMIALRKTKGEETISLESIMQEYNV